MTDEQVKNLVDDLIRLYSMGRRLQVGAYQERPEIPPSAVYGQMSSHIEDILVRYIGEQELIRRLKEHPMTAEVAWFVEHREERLRELGFTQDDPNPDHPRVYPLNRKRRTPI